MNKKSELNKYNKKTVALQKKLCPFKTEQIKDHRVVWGRLLLNYLFSFIRKKGTFFAYLYNTARSKAKIQQ